MLRWTDVHQSATNLRTISEKSLKIPPSTTHNIVKKTCPCTMYNAEGQISMCVSFDPSDGAAAPKPLETVVKGRGDATQR